MREVLISIQPRWVEKIVSGEKTVEVRRTRPKCETPFKCYIYETKALYKPNGCKCLYEGKGKVIGEFVCDRIIGTCPWRLKGETGLCAKRTEEETNLPNNACLTLEEIEKYAGSRGRGIYGWHITDLVVYDEPRELGEFMGLRKLEGTILRPPYHITTEQPYSLTRPPQSWQFCVATEPRQTAD